MDDQWRWVIGLAVTIILGWTTILTGIGWRFISSLQKLEHDMHEQINEVKRDYVRRSDLDGHITRLGEDVRQIRAEMLRAHEVTSTRLDAVLAALAARPASRSTRGD
jgi:hypothetical protein